MVFAMQIPKPKQTLGVFRSIALEVTFRPLATCIEGLRLGTSASSAGAVIETLFRNEAP
jgi:hypothetical protein